MTWHCVYTVPSHFEYQWWQITCWGQVMSKSIWEDIVRNNWWIFMTALFMILNYSYSKAFVVFIASWWWVSYRIINFHHKIFILISLLCAMKTWIKHTKRNGIKNILNDLCLVNVNYFKLSYSLATRNEHKYFLDHKNLSNRLFMGLMSRNIGMFKRSMKTGYIW